MWLRQFTIVRLIELGSLFSEDGSDVRQGEGQLLGMCSGL